MNSRDLCIIHLSDLHFAGGSARLVYQKLLRDIEEQIANEENVVLVVTGDFATKSKVKENKNAILSFFEELEEVLSKKKLLDVELVPGNHDGKRADKTTDYNNKSFLLDKREYADIQRSIYEVFHRDSPNVVPKDSCGVSTIEFNDCRIVFARLDTSSYELPDRLKEQIKNDLGTLDRGLNDEGEQLFEQYVLAFKRDLKRQCEEIAAKCSDEVKEHAHLSPDLTIFLAHHPLSVLNMSGLDDQEESLFKNKLEFGDVWLSGHTHIAQNCFSSDNNRQRIMLSTGLGWNESIHDLLRYSIYRLNFERNTCQVSVRYSTSNKDFDVDRISGSNEESRHYMHETLPLKLDSVGAAIHSNLATGGHCRSMFVDNLVVRRIPRILAAFDRAHHSFYNTVFAVNAAGEQRISSLRDKLRTCWKLIRTGRVESENVLKFNNHLLKTYITTICSQIACVLEELTNLPETEEKEGGTKCESLIQWRVHSRRYKGMRGSKVRDKDDVYVAIKSVDAQGGALANPSDVAWEGMISAASKISPHVLIDSANPLVNKHNTSWSDFMTIIPSGALFHKRFDNAIRRPLLTFGISFKAADRVSLKTAARILYLMEFLGVHTLIDDALQLFLLKYSPTRKDIENAVW